MNQSSYWDDFYAQGVNLEPSSFAMWLQTYINLKTFELLDWGCGNGRDGLFLSQFAAKVVMFDSSSKAISVINDVIKKESITNSIAQVFDINNSNNYEDFDGGDIVHYARFFLHAIDDSGMSNFFRHLNEISKKMNRSLAVFEYRIEEDQENLYYTYGNHSRWLRAPSTIVREMSDRGWELKFEDIGKGLAVFGEENPLIARQVFEYTLS